MFVPFDPPASPDDVPEVFPTPFRQGAPHPLAARAATELQASLDANPDITPSMVRGPLGGKMFGVLVVRVPDGRLGYLRGFAGMVGGRRDLPGFVPPAFDTTAHERLWSTEGAVVCRLDQEIATLEGRAPLSPADAQRLLQLRAQQRDRSQALLPKLQATYRIPNARGETSGLEALFEPRPVPGGAGDCAAPKLLAHAYSIGARPLALAEFWWGDSTPAGGRHHGVFYPACRGKCAKLLPFMLLGIPCEPPPEFGNHGVRDDAPEVLFEDECLLVVHKPSGLLSVPGRGASHRDCVQTRIQHRMGFADRSWPRLAHRLDQPTSGLLIAAKSKSVYVALQQQFSRRQIEKRYVAVVVGPIVGDRGTIELPLRPDIDDRPRQMHDPVHGKPAITRWQVLKRHATTTRVALFPQTGRTHQLRLHAAHAQGLGAPIVGDPLYGFGGPRLHLHAESMTLMHPGDGTPLRLHAPAPF